MNVFSLETFFGWGFTLKSENKDLITVGISGRESQSPLKSAKFSLPFAYDAR